MSVNFSFNAHTVDPNVAPEAVPTAQYVIAMTKAEEKEVNGKPGVYLAEFGMTIQEGDHKGKVVKYRINHKNDSEQARNIALGELSALCHVIGVMQFNNFAELFNRPFKANIVKVPNSQDSTRDYNEIRGVFDMAGNPPKKGQTAAGADTSGNAAAFGATTTTTATTAAPGLPAAPGVTAPAAPLDPLAAAVADGWIQHPQSEPHMYKGQEVKLKAEVVAAYTPPNPSAAGATTSAPAAPAAPATGAASAAIPSWAQ